MSTRDESLKELGFSSYSDYLESPMWKAIQVRALERAKGKCACCGDRATQVHHRAYDVATMRGAVPKNLVALCRVCHRAIEFGKTNKLGTETANERLEIFSDPVAFSPDADDGLPPDNGKMQEPIFGVRRKGRKQP